MKQNTDYGFAIQKLYLEMMLADSSTFARCQSIFDATLFDKKLQKAAEFINEYANSHTVMPTEEIINAATGSDFKISHDLREEHFDWLLNDFETFIRHKGLERAIIESADMLESGEYGAVEEKIKKAVQIGLTKDLGTDYFANPKERLMKIKDTNGQMSTGWKALDRMLFGGMNRGELHIFCAGSGGGKSLFLANLGINYALAGLNVVYVTLELSEELVSMRVDSMLTGTSTREVFKQIDDVDMKVRMIGKKAGSLQVKYMPSGKTANDLRAYLKEYEIKLGRKVDIILVDYLDLLMPNNKKISAENLFLKDKFVSEELRNLAMEKKTVLISASQLNRAATQEVEFDHSHISGGLSKIQTADAVYGIFTSRALRERGQYQVQLMKTRNSSGVGQTFNLAFNVDTLRISDCEDDEYSDAGGSNSSHSATTGSNLIASIKQRATVTADVETAAPVGKVKAEVGSSKLRQLLNNLPNDD